MRRKNSSAQSDKSADNVPYDIADSKQTASYWSGAVVTKGGGAVAVQQALSAARKGRGPQKTPTKELINIRLSPDVLDAFRSSGRGWQTKIDGALKEWLEKHRVSA
jgi:uncharacterized protein (DUF4415 family)